MCPRIVDKGRLATDVPELTAKITDLQLSICQSTFTVPTLTYTYNRLALSAV